MRKKEFFVSIKMATFKAEERGSESWIEHPLVFEARHEGRCGNSPSKQRENTIWQLLFELCERFPEYILVVREFSKFVCTIFALFPRASQILALIDYRCLKIF